MFLWLKYDTITIALKMVRERDVKKVTFFDSVI